MQREIANSDQLTISSLMVPPSMVPPSKMTPPSLLNQEDDDDEDVGRFVVHRYRTVFVPFDEPVAYTPGYAQAPTTPYDPDAVLRPLVQYEVTHCSTCNRTAVANSEEDARTYAFTPANCPNGEALLEDPLYRSVRVVLSNQ